MTVKTQKKVKKFSPMYLPQAPDTRRLCHPCACSSIET